MASDSPKATDYDPKIIEELRGIIYDGFFLSSGSISDAVDQIVQDLCEAGYVDQIGCDACRGFICAHIC